MRLTLLFCIHWTANQCPLIMEWVIANQILFAIICTHFKVVYYWSVLLCTAFVPPIDDILYNVFLIFIDECPWTLMQFITGVALDFDRFQVEFISFHFFQKTLEVRFIEPKSKLFIYSIPSQSNKEYKNWYCPTRKIEDRPHLSYH